MPGRVAEVEQRLGVPGNDVVRPGPGGDVRHLEAGWREVLAAFVPHGVGQLRQQPCHIVDRIAGEMGVGDVALDAPDRDGSAQRPAPPDLHGVAEPVGARRLADQAPVDALAAPAEGLHDPADPVHRRSLLVAGDEQRDGAVVLRVPVDEALEGGDHGCDASLHVGGAASVEAPVAERRLERRAAPLFEGTGRHHVGMSQQHQQRTVGPAPGPEIVHVGEGYRLRPEAERGQSLGEDRLAAGVLGGDRGAANQLAREREGLRCAHRCPDRYIAPGDRAEPPGISPRPPHPLPPPCAASCRTPGRARTPA